MDKNKKIKIFFLLLYVLLACCLVYFWRPIYIISIIVVLLPPSILNFYWLKNSRARVLIFSIVALFLFAPPVELMARLKDVWDVSSVFPRILGLIPLENMLFAFLNFFWGLSFYEYFINNDRPGKINKNFKYLIDLFLIFSVIVFSLYFYNKDIIGANYITIAVIVLIIPMTWLFFKKPILIKKTIIPTLFFALVFFVYELVSLKIGSWFWPGDYLFPVKIWGEVFPLDDVIIWYFLSTPALILGYEFFADDFS